MEFENNITREIETESEEYQRGKEMTTYPEIIRKAMS